LRTFHGDAVVVESMKRIMDNIAAFITVSLAILLGAMSPGPSFVIVARTAISSSRGHGVAAALGMGVGGAIFAVVALSGLQIVFVAVPSLYRALQFAGALYLLFIAYKLWMSSPKPLVVLRASAVQPESTPRTFLLGLLTQLSNPKTAIVYASVFSAALSDAPSAFMTTMLVAAIFAIEFGWYAVVAVAFSTDRARYTYVRGKAWIDRLAAAAIGLLGAKILAELRPS
jgi:threonine/homoserine/homoserine lactone efflux protein